MAKVPPQDERCNSWIVVSKETGKAVFETWNENVVIAVDETRYDIFTALAWLQKINREIRDRRELEARSESGMEGSSI